MPHDQTGLGFSIITINYNNSEGLHKTIESTICQTCKNFEHIVIDGGSTDGSVEIIKSSEKGIAYWISEPDNGIYNAQNKGIERARGKYCFFLNSGDVFASDNVLEKIFNGSSEADIIYGNMVKVYQDRVITDKSFMGSKISMYDLYTRNLNHQATFIKRKLFEEYGLYEEEYKIVADWVWWVRAIGLGKASVAYIDMDISRFDMYGVGSQQIPLRQQERDSALQRLIPLNVLADYEEMSKLKKEVRVLRKINERTLSRLAFKVFRKVFS